MMKPPVSVTSVVIAGLGGQGVLTASDIVAGAAFRAGHDVKKSEIHGMSQRGGSVTSDVRFGPRVFSPMTPEGEADFLVVLSPDQMEVNRAALKPGGLLIEPSRIGERVLKNRKSLNIALLGILSRYVDVPEEAWLAAIREALPPHLHQANLQAFAAGRSL
jgi:indolepyruvate ferredoxin oxidoreductase beta subunit